MGALVILLSELLRVWILGRPSVHSREKALVGLDKVLRRNHQLILLVMTIGLLILFGLVLSGLRVDCVVPVVLEHELLQLFVKVQCELNRRRVDVELDVVNHVPRSL